MTCGRETYKGRYIFIANIPIQRISPYLLYYYNCTSSIELYLKIINEKDFNPSLFGAICRAVNVCIAACEFLRKNKKNSFFRLSGGQIKKNVFFLRNDPMGSFFNFFWIWSNVDPALPFLGKTYESVIFIILASKKEIMLALVKYTNAEFYVILKNSTNTYFFVWNRQMVNKPMFETPNDCVSFHWGISMAWICKSIMREKF